MLTGLDELPGRMRTVREARGLDLPAAAVEIGIASSTLWRFETCKPGTVGVARAVLRWLHGIES